MSHATLKEILTRICALEPGALSRCSKPSASSPLVHNVRADPTVRAEQPTPGRAGLLAGAPCHHRGRAPMSWGVKSRDTTGKSLLTCATWRQAKAAIRSIVCMGTNCLEPQPGPPSPGRPTPWHGRAKSRVRRFRRPVLVIIITALIIVTLTINPSLGDTIVLGVAILAALDQVTRPRPK